MKNHVQVFVVGMAIFSMFFGGGNLTFPLWIGAETSSVFLSSIGFILSGVLLPFYGIMISLYFKGDYHTYLSACGKTIGNLLIFALLLFWIPLGSGPRCNQLAHGAFCCQIGYDIPLWVYSAIYSVVVYLLTFRENRVIEILGKIITPTLIVVLLVLIYSIFPTLTYQLETMGRTNYSSWDAVSSSFFAGYSTMDFIAAIFFSSAVIALTKEKNGFDIVLVRRACIVAVTLLSIIYVSLITVGFVNAEILREVPKDRLLATIGRSSFGDEWQIIVFMIITLSVLSTSMALSLVFANYLRVTLFKNKQPHKSCLLISISLSFLMSIVGFEQLNVLISYATSMLYPCLLLMTTIALIKNILTMSPQAEISVGVNSVVEKSQPGDFVA
jgi:branched-chain amino acid:cation transporter, LIVCS family